MDTPMLKGSRQVQILKALHEYGPLSRSTLRKLLVPTIDERRLRDATQRLLRKGLILRREDSLPDNAGHHFQNRQSADARVVIGKLLGLHPDQLFQPHIRSQELTHSGICALWANKLKRLFPDALVIRDFHFSTHPLVSKTLLGQKKDLEIRPDLLIHFSTKQGCKRVTVGIEIEKTRKVRKRLVRKLTKLAAVTKLDGIIYLCSTDTITDALLDVYETQVRGKHIRVRHYSADFMLVGNYQQPLRDIEPILLNADLKSISVSKWMHNFRMERPSATLANYSSTAAASG